MRIIGGLVMLLGLLLRLLLWVALGAVVLSVALLLAIDLHLVDWVMGSGSSAYDALHATISFLRESYRINRANVDLALKIIGIATTIVFGGVLPALYAWRFGYINLPSRLQNYADHFRKEHLIDRAIVLGSLSARNLRGDPAAVGEPSLAGRVLHSTGLDNIQRALRRIRADQGNLDGDVRILGSNLEKCKAQRITIHLAEALKHATRAKTWDAGSRDQLTENQAALKECAAALALKADDLDTLEQAAKLAKQLNLTRDLHLHLDNLERSAIEQKRPVRQARALRLQAELLGERSTKAAMRDARLRLETALDALDTADESSERPLELALTNEQLGALHLKRGTPTLVTPYLDAADKLFESLGSAEGKAGKARVTELRNQLAIVLSGGDDANDQDDGAPAAVADVRATHVNSSTLPVHSEPGETSPVTRELPPYTAVAVLRDDPSWPLIGKDGEMLGYVSARDLHRLS